MPAQAGRGLLEALTGIRSAHLPSAAESLNAREPLPRAQIPEELGLVFLAIWGQEPTHPPHAASSFTTHTTIRYETHPPCGVGTMPNMFWVLGGSQRHSSR